MSPCGEYIISTKIFDPGGENEREVTVWHTLRTANPLESVRIPRNVFTSSSGQKLGDLSFGAHTLHITLELSNTAVTRDIKREWHEGLTELCCIHGESVHTCVEVGDKNGRLHSHTVVKNIRCPDDTKAGKDMIRS